MDESTDFLVGFYIALALLGVAVVVAWKMRGIRLRSRLEFRMPCFKKIGSFLDYGEKRDII